MDKQHEQLPAETLSDVAAERAVLSGIYQYGSDAYYDVVDFTNEETFTVESNAILFKCLQAIIKKDDSTKIDIPSILSIAKELSLDHIVERRDEMRHMKNIISFPVELTNVRKFAAKIRKLQIARLLQNHLQGAQDDIIKLKGDESITHILGIAEDTIFNFTSLINDGGDESPQQLGIELDKYLKNLVDNPVDQVGISTGFTQYDNAIGGGLRRGTVNIIGARPKAQPLTSKILTPNGWKFMYTINVGDIICSPTNKTGVTKVVGVYPQGLKDTYKFTFSDNTIVLASKDHYWKVKHRRWTIDKYKILSFNDMLDGMCNNNLLESDHRPKWQFPLINHAMLQKQNNLIDPYVLGCLLGDGGITHAVTFTTADIEIINILNNKLPHGYYFKKQKGNKYGWSLNSNRQRSIIKQELIKLKLFGCGSHAKFIPEQYLYSSVEDRTLLLCGLLDTDGSVSDSGTIEYSTVSYNLTNDTQELVRSLGGMCKFKQRTTKCNGKSFLSYRVHISFNDASKYFLLTRKINKTKVRTKPDLKRGLIEVKSIGKMEMQCIKVDESDGLYITDDYIVTHNTGKTLLADNMALHITKEIDIPVLNLDTEMRKEDHINRCLASMSEVSIRDIETGQFGQKADVKQKILDAYGIFKDLKYYHKSIGGIEIEEQIAIIRRWLIKEVGLESNGLAKPCVIMYDYIKLMTTEGLKKNLQEYQLLGFLITSLHNFALRYGIPILAFCQLNRDGITKENTDVSSGSDRIMWLCSNFTIFKNKSDEEIANDGTDAGNRKLVPIVSRHGEGLKDKDYINCHMKGWCGQVKEGLTRNDLHNKTNDADDGLDNVKF